MPGLIRWLSRRSLRFAHALGAALGWLTYAVSGAYRARFRENTHLAGIGAAATRPAIAHAGRMVAELPRLWLRPADQALGSLVQWQGAELVDSALDAGRGLVLLTPHLGCFEMCAQGYAERFGVRRPITALYRPARQAWLRELEASARNRPGLVTAPANLAGVRQMLRALRQGHTVGLLPDQVPPEGMGVWAPFFGRNAYTMTLAARLVQQSGATWLLMVCERLPSGTGYRLSVSAPPQPLPPKTGTGEAAEAAHQTECAAIINGAMEHLIRQHPGQYLWGYHRYKLPRTAA